MAADPPPPNEPMPMKTWFSKVFPGFAFFSLLAALGFAAFVYGRLAQVEPAIGGPSGTLGQFLVTIAIPAAVVFFLRGRYEKAASAAGEWATKGIGAWPPMIVLLVALVVLGAALYANGGVRQPAVHCDPGDHIFWTTPVLGEAHQNTCDASPTIVRLWSPNQPELTAGSERRRCAWVDASFDCRAPPVPPPPPRPRVTVEVVSYASAVDAGIEVVRQRHPEIDIESTTVTYEVARRRACEGTAAGTVLMVDDPWLPRCLRRLRPVDTEMVATVFREGSAPEVGRAFVGGRRFLDLATSDDGVVRALPFVGNVMVRWRSPAARRVRWGIRTRTANTLVEVFFALAYAEGYVPTFDAEGRLIIDARQFSRVVRQMATFRGVRAEEPCNLAESAEGWGCAEHDLERWLVRGEISDALGWPNWGARYFATTARFFDIADVGAPALSGVWYVAVPERDTSTEAMTVAVELAAASEAQGALARSGVLPMLEAAYETPPPLREEGVADPAAALRTYWPNLHESLAASAARPRMVRWDQFETSFAESLRDALRNPRARPTVSTEAPFILR